MLTDLFCPFCGQPNAANFRFCRKCGKALPDAASADASESLSQAAEAPQAVMVPPLPPDDLRVLPSTPAVDEDASVERALTDAERKVLLSTLRRPLPNATRVLGTLFGVMPLFLIFMGLAGTSFPADSYTATVFGTAVIGIVFGAVSATRRTPVLKAIARGTAVETRGVPEPRVGAPPGMTRFRLGEREFLLPAVSGGSLLEGRLNALATVDLGPTKFRSPHPGWKRVVLLELNGSSPTSNACFIPEDPKTGGPRAATLSEGLAARSR